MIKLVIFDWAGTTIDYGSFAPVKGFINGFRKYGVEITGYEARQPMGLKKIDHTRAIANISRVSEEFFAANDRKPSEADIQDIYTDFEKSLMDNIKDHVDIKDHVIETVAELRKRGIKIGSTTGYTRSMMDEVTKLSSANGYTPDFVAAADDTPKGRPYPYMIWENMTKLEVDNPRHVIKVGDTVADIQEGLNANTWTVAVITGSNEMGLTRKEAAAIPQKELDVMKQRARSVFYAAGADYIINDMDELAGVVDDINRVLLRNTPRKLMTPGPLTTRASVKQAMLTDHCTWSDDYKRIALNVSDKITAIAADESYATVLLQGSGSYAVESMICSICNKNEKILFLVNGEYGNRMLRIANKADKTYRTLTFDPCKPIDINEFEKVLTTDTEIKTVVFVHCETTTGVFNPLREIVSLAKQYGKTVLVDAMSSFGAYDIDMPTLGIDALAASANKCLEGLPGLAFVIAKKSVLEKAQNSNSHCLDLLDQYETLRDEGGKFRFTSPTNILLALEQAISEYYKEGGLKARGARYAENHRMLIQGLAEAGISPIVKPEHQSYIITTFALGDLNFKQLYESLKSEGFIIYPGKLTDLPTFRIGAIGDVFPSDIKRLTDAIKRFCSQI
jgi:2-aminoethylphosphonate--pyruvate transaminase/phosphonoacetaldehyde hydrolase